MKYEFEVKSNRGKEFLDFAKGIVDHIENYTTVQYGDLDFDDPENGDLMQLTDIPEIVNCIERYLKRMATNARGRTEQLRDLQKIAHYACIIHGKYVRGEIELSDITAFFYDPEKETREEFISRIDSEITILESERSQQA